MPNQVRRPNLAVVADEQAQILALRKVGKSIRDIAETLNMSPTTVQKRLKQVASILPVRPPMTPEKVELHKDVYERRLRGESPNSIAEDIGVSAGTVRNYIKNEIAARVLPARDEYVQQSLDRIDIAVTKIMAQIENDKAVARNAEVLVKLMERQAKMLGYDAPTQTENLVVVETRPEVLNLIEQARTKMEERETALRATAQRLDKPAIEM